MDQLLVVIDKYHAEEALIEKTWSTRSADNNAKMIASNDKSLARQAKGLPAGPESALAAFELLREHYFEELGEPQNEFEDAMLVMADALKGYLSSQAGCEA
jgi:hypothetical protein